MNDKTVPNKFCPASDSKFNLDLQTPNNSEMSHTGLLSNASDPTVATAVIL